MEHVTVVSAPLQSAPFVRCHSAEFGHANVFSTLEACSVMLFHALIKEEL